MATKCVKACKEAGATLKDHVVSVKARQVKDKEKEKSDLVKKLLNDERATSVWHAFCLCPLKGSEVDASHHPISIFHCLSFACPVPPPMMHNIQFIPPSFFTFHLPEHPQALNPLLN